MATIIVEDGTGKTNSNSYISEADFSTWLADRGITLTGDAGELLIKANDYLETLVFIGNKYSEAQALQWPRYNVHVDGFYIEPATIPKDLKTAQMQFAVSINAGVDPLATIGRATKKVKLDVMEIEYMDNASSQPFITAGNAALSKLLAGGGLNFKVSRG
jgi:hypothetical protein